MLLSIGIARSLRSIANENLGGLNFLALPELFNCRYSPDELSVIQKTDDVIQSATEITGIQPDLNLIVGTLPMTDKRRSVLFFSYGRVPLRIGKCRRFRRFRG